ncbi:MAG: ATP-binding protein [Caldilinea sp.]|uniref:ATP-binding protein n=1 Tax=Caldilinea sp. TaxID=2293560 RepID=UPI00309F3D9D
MSHPAKILLIGSDKTLLAEMENLLRSAALTVMTMLWSDALLPSARNGVARIQANLAIVDLRALADPLDAFRRLQLLLPETPCMALASPEQELLVETALAEGAVDCMLTTPKLQARLLKRVRLLLELENASLHALTSRRRGAVSFDNAPIGLFRCTSGGMLTVVNSTMARILGVSSRELLQETLLWDWFVDREEAGRWRDVFTAQWSLYSGECWMRRADNATLWARVSIEWVVEPESGFIYGEGLLEDITEQRRVQSALRASEEKLRLIFEHAFDGISIYEELPESGSRRLLECNDRYCEMAGRSREELLTIGNTSLVHRKIGRVFTRAENLFIRQHKIPYRGFFSWIRPDGKPNVIEYSAAPIDVEGRPLTIGIDRDITDQIQAQESAMRRADHMEAINAVIGAAAAAVDARALLEHAVQALVQGLIADGAVMWTRDEIAVAGIDEAEARRWMARFDRTQASAYLIEDASSPASSGQGERWLAAPIVHEGRLFGGLMARGADVDAWPEDALALASAVGKEVGAAVERFHLFEQTLQQGRIAAVGRLAAGVAHDFNNILAVILLQTQLLELEPTLSEKSRLRLHTIAERTQYAANLVRQILDFSLKSVLNKAPVNLSLLIDEVADLLRRTFPENIQIIVENASLQGFVHGDFTMLKQALLNLALNAQDAMPEGGTLSLRVERLEGTGDSRADHHGEWLRLTVRDDGVGIPADVLPHIFEPFFTTKEVGKGVGLGLAQVYGIVKQHGGEVSAVSQPGQGAAFFIDLPAFHPEPPIAPPTLPTGPSASVRLLYVEDESLLRETFCDLLELHGYEVWPAADGEEALARYGERLAEVDLMITDLAMPGMNGVELHRELRRRLPSLRTIVLSGYPAEHHLSHHAYEGIVAWLQKPVGVATLTAQIEEALKAKA